MKAITKERILRALDKIQEVGSKKTDADRAIVSKMAEYGMKGMLGNLDNLKGDRVSLESAYLGDIPSSEEELKVIIERWKRNVDRYLCKRDRVYEIQNRHSISGLIMGETELGDWKIGHPVEHPYLLLTDDDLNLLNEYKPKMFEFWVSYITSNKLTPYRSFEESWVETSIEKIRALLPFFQWAKVWEDIEPEDNRHEVVFILGRGRYFMDEGVDNITSFCACNLFPRIR